MHNLEQGCGRKIGPYSCCTVVCGDSLKLLKKLPEGLIGSIVTDPPYGLQDKSGGYGRASVHGGVKRKIANDKDLSIVQLIAPLLNDALKDHGWLLTFCGSSNMLEFGDYILDGGLNYFGQMIWYKKMPGLSFSLIRYSHEPCLVFTKGKPQKESESVISVIEALAAHQDTKNRHPHEKPLRVAMKLVGMTTGTVLDPFCGTGAFVVAAKILGRHFLGFELEEAYVRQANRRLAECVPLPTRGNKNKPRFLYHEL